MRRLQFPCGRLSPSCDVGSRVPRGVLDSKQLYIRFANLDSYRHKSSPGSKFEERT